MNIFIKLLLCRNSLNIFYSNYGNITLKINKAGKDIYVFHDMYLSTCSLTEATKPSYVYINGVKQKDVKSKYDFNQTNNIVKLFYDYVIRSTICMFLSCSNITEIDLSKFQTRNIRHFNGMFQGYTSLTSINLAYFTTAQISDNRDIQYIFFNCSSLAYINLKNSYLLSKQLSTLFDDLKNNTTICDFQDINDLEKNTKNFKHTITIFCDFNNVPTGDKCIKNFQTETNLTCRNHCGRNYEVISHISTETIFYCNNTESNELSYGLEEQISCNGLYMHEIDGKCYEVCPKNSYKTKTKKCLVINFDGFNNKTELYYYIKQIVLIELDISEVNNKNIDLEIDCKHFLLSLTTTFNQKKNLIQNENKTIINLEQCEQRLKSKNILPGNNSLYLIKLDLGENGMKIPKVEYEAFYQTDTEEFIQINLEECENTNINIYYPVKLNKDVNIDQYNKSSDYYNNICSKTKSNKGTDISLTDRKNIFINNNMTLCEEDCDLVEYNYNTSKAKCSCFTKVKLPLIEDIKFNKEILFKSFIDINNIANIKFMKCVNEVFKIKNLIKNYGFFIFIFFIIFHFCTLILFYFKFYSILINEIKLLFEAKINHNNKKYKNIIKTQPIYPPRNRKKNKFIKKIEELNFDNNYKTYKEIMELNESELNSLNYKKAIIYDKRTFVEYYLSLLKHNHLIFFSFYHKGKDYNSKIIKIFLFFFFFSTNLTINALFFNDDTMHKIYIDEGNFNLIYQISQIIYSFLISNVLDILIKFLSLTEESILQFKKLKIKYLDKKFKKILSKIKIKFILFLIITFLLLLLFTYYITCFCGVYVNTQIHLIIDSIIGFGLSLIYPFVQYIISSLLRFFALRAKKKNMNCIYKISQFIQNY